MAPWYQQTQLLLPPAPAPGRGQGAYPSVAMATAIEFHAVSKRFPGGAVALDNATWKVEDRTRVCLLGPRGSGKTTTIRILQGALRPTGGSVTLLGVSVLGPGYREVRRRVGIVPQKAGMYTDLSAGEYLALAGRLYDVNPDWVARSLDLHEYLHARMSELSGSFQRRLALAVALVADPEVLLLDEPTAGLEAPAASDLLGYLDRAMENRTTLLCTPHAAEATQLCRRIIPMRAGRVVDEGGWEDEHRQQPRLRLSARQGPDRLLAELENLGRQAEIDGESVLVEVTDPQEEGADLVKALVKADVDVYECSLASLRVEVAGAEAPP